MTTGNSSLSSCFWHFRLATPEMWVEAPSEEELILCCPNILLMRAQNTIVHTNEIRCCVSHFKYICTHAKLYVCQDDHSSIFISANDLNNPNVQLLMTRTSAPWNPYLKIKGYMHVYACTCTHTERETQLYINVRCKNKRETIWMEGKIRRGPRWWCVWLKSNDIHEWKCQKLITLCVD